MSTMPSKGRLFKYFAGGAVLALLFLFTYTQLSGNGESGILGSASFSEADWQVGELRPDGLRVLPSGRSDSTAVLDPRQFIRPEVRRAYAIAHTIPETLNKLYCWCRCPNRGHHRSNLACFEDEMSVNCDVCRGTAEIAYRMIQEGVTDAGKIQAAVDEEWKPKS